MHMGDNQHTVQYGVCIDILLLQGPIAVKQSLMEVYTAHKLWLLLMNGISFHMQSVAAYLTMSFISPVTFRYE